MKPVMFRRAYPLILGVLFLAAATAWAADPKRNLAVAPGTPAAPTETRVALVIGNSNYKSAPLRNPVNDAQAIAESSRASASRSPSSSTRTRGAWPRPSVSSAIN